MVVATFGGKHNIVKSCAFLVLEAYHGGLLLSELATFTGCDYKSLSVLVGRWCRWHYISRQETSRGYRYRLRVRGKRFIEDRLPLPLRNQIVSALNAMHNDREAADKARLDKILTQNKVG